MVAPASAAGHIPVRILALGDSLTAGYGLADLKDSFPQQLQRALVAKGYAVTILPGGVSGDTTTGGLNRLAWALAAKPDGVIVELGANDALRAIEPKLTEDNLHAIVTRIQHDHIPLLLAGMMAPPNLGHEFTDRFDAIYPRLAKETGVLFYPFFLDGVAAKPELNQQDHMHPTAEGVAVIVARMLPTVEKLVTQAEAFARQRGAP
jgi:acyl-CoA thioesterase-1